MSISRKNVNTEKVNERRTICEVHREIYDILYDHFRTSPHYQETVDKLQEAYTMAKKMNEKLKQYKFNYDDDWWEATSKQVTKEKLEKRANRNAPIKHE